MEEVHYWTVDSFSDGCAMSAITSAVKRSIGFTITSTPVQHSVLNVKALLGALNQDQEKALVRTYSVIVKTECETDGSFYSTSNCTHCTTI